MKHLLHFLFFYLGMAAANCWAQQPVLVLQKGHNKKINSVRFSQDGKLMVTTGDDGIIKIWDSYSQKLVTELGGNGVVYLDAFFSADNKRIIARAEIPGNGEEVNASSEGGINTRYYSLRNNTCHYVWDIETSQLVQSASYLYESHSFTPNNTWLATHRTKIIHYVPAGAPAHITDTAINIYEWSTGKLLKRLPQYQDTTTEFEPLMAFVSDSLLLTGVQSCSLPQGKKIYVTKYRVINFFTDAETAAFNDTTATYNKGGLVVSPGGRYFLRSGDDGTVLWDLRQQVPVWRMPAGVSSASFAAGDAAILMSFQMPAPGNIPDTHSRRLVYLVPGDTARTLRPADQFTEDLLATCSNHPPLFATAVMEIRKGASPGESADTSFRVNIRNSTNTILSTCQTKEPVTAIVFSPNDKILVTGYADGNISLWDFKDSLAKEVASSGNAIDPIIQLHTGRVSKKVWYITRSMYGMQDANSVDKLSFISPGSARVNDVHYLLKDKYSILQLAEKYADSGSFLIINNDTPTVVKTLRYTSEMDMMPILGGDSNLVRMTGKNKWQMKLNYPGLRSFTIYTTLSDMVNPNRHMFLQNVSLMSGILQTGKVADTTLLITTPGNTQYNATLKSYVFTYDVPYAVRKAAPKDIAYPVTGRPTHSYLPEPVISDDGSYLLGRDFNGEYTDPKFYYCQDLKGNIVFKTPVFF